MYMYMYMYIHIYKYFCVCIYIYPEPRSPEIRNPKPGPEILDSEPSNATQRLAGPTWKTETRNRTPEPDTPNVTLSLAGSKPLPPSAFGC